MARHPSVVPPRRITFSPHGTTPPPHAAATPPHGQAKIVHTTHPSPETQGEIAAAAVALNMASFACTAVVVWLYLHTPKERRSGTAKLVLCLSSSGAAFALFSAVSEAGTAVACLSISFHCRREHTAVWALFESARIWLLRCSGAWSGAVALHLLLERLSGAGMIGYSFARWQRAYHCLCWLGTAMHMQACALLNGMRGPRAASAALYAGDALVLLVVPAPSIRSRLWPLTRATQLPGARFAQTEEPAASPESRCATGCWHFSTTCGSGGLPWDGPSSFSSCSRLGASTGLLTNSCMITLSSHAGARKFACKSFLTHHFLRCDSTRKTDLEGSSARALHSHTPSASYRTALRFVRPTLTLTGCGRMFECV